MARVKRGVTAHARHKKVLKLAKGYRGRSKNAFRVAIEKVEKGLQYAYRDRRNRKRAFRALWIQRINAGARENGLTYAQMGRYLDANGKPTNDEKAAAINPQTKKPLENGLRNMWVNETALTTALNTAYFAEQVATFAIVMGIALLLAGIGFGILSLKALPVTDRKEERAPAMTAVPTA